MRYQELKKKQMNWQVIPLLNLGIVEMFIAKYVQLAGEEFVDAKYNIVELLELAWGREIHLALDLNSQWRGML